MKNKLIILGIAILILSCAKPEARKPIVRKTSSFISESVERNKTLNSKEESALKNKMALDSVQEYINSEFGFWYTYNVIDSLNTALPVKGDEILFSYEIRSLNDEIIYTKEELGTKRYFVDQEELITGLQEGLKLMKQGEIVTFLFPSHKAYGYTGNDKIHSNQPLIYQIHLIEIINKTK